MDARIRQIISDRGVAVAAKDIFIACYDAIIARRIVSVSELIEYLEDLEWHPRLELIVRKCYRLIRELHWGVFKDLNRRDYADLWNELVIPDRRLEDIGDLKRNIQVSSLYCGLMDIHEYTEFCQKHRHNFSMLRTLDDIIQKDTRLIAAKNHCLSYRTAGDNIVLIGSEPLDLLRSCLGIIDIFSRKRVLRDSGLAESRSGKSIVLQDVHVTAGIAGGLQYSSLVITRDGDVSGSIINTAARLQSFANSLSPLQSKVMVTSQVYARASRELRKLESGPESTIGFFGCGKIHFKGVDISVHEVLYREDDMRKTEYEQEYAQLLRSMKRGVWNDEIIGQALLLAIRALEIVPIPRIELYVNGVKEVYNTRRLIAECREALHEFRNGHAHRLLSAHLLEIQEVLASASGFDRLVQTRFGQVATLYDKMARDFESRQYEQILSHRTALFNAKEQQVMDSASRLAAARDMLIERGRLNTEAFSPELLWKEVVADHEGSWEFEVYSGKK